MHEADVIGDRAHFAQLDNAPRTIGADQPKTARDRP